MLHREKLHLLAALMVAAEANREGVTYLVLSLRLAGLGGDRACRAMVDELKQTGWIQVQRQSGVDSDQREKAVSVTAEGWAALAHYARLVARTAERPVT